MPTIGPKPHTNDWQGRRDYDTAWQRMLFEAGYAGINWPKEYGGRGATPTEHLIFLEESERHNVRHVRVQAEEYLNRLDVIGRFVEAQPTHRRLNAHRNPHDEFARSFRV